MGNFNSDIGTIIGLETRTTNDDLTDLHTKLNRDHRATHASGNQLDRILISPSLIDRRGITFSRIRNRRDLNRRTSDHYPVVAEFSTRSRRDLADSSPREATHSDAEASAVGNQEKIRDLLEAIEKIELELSSLKSRVRQLSGDQ